MSASNLNAFPHKIETAIQGTPTGVLFCFCFFLPPEDKVQVHLNLINQALVLEAFHRC